MLLKEGNLFFLSGCAVDTIKELNTFYCENFCTGVVQLPLDQRTNNGRFGLYYSDAFDKKIGE